MYSEIVLETIKNQFFAKVLFILFIFFSFWWAFMSWFLPKEHFLYGFYGTLYGIIAAWSGGWGLMIAREWGMFKSVMGKAIIMFSLGLFAQEFGQCAYTFYIFVLHVDVPYPSVGDIGFFGTIPFYIYGAYLLAKASGVRFSLRSYSSKLQAVLIPLGMLSAAYFLFLKDYTFDLNEPIKTFLDFGYPFGQAIYISIAILTYSLTRSILGGIMKSKVLFIIVAFGVQFLADYAFIYFHDQYYPGSLLDYVYVLAYFLMGIGIFQLHIVANKLKSE